MKERIKKVSEIVSIILLVGCFMFLQGCAGKQSVVGTWVCQNDESHEGIMALYENGTCFNSPIDDAISYKIQGEKLIFSTSQGDSVSYSLAESETEALESEDKYYLSEDTIVLGQERYERVLNGVIGN